MCVLDITKERIPYTFSKTVSSGKKFSSRSVSAKYMKLLDKKSNGFSGHSGYPVVLKHLMRKIWRVIVSVGETGRRNSGCWPTIFIIVATQHRLRRPKRTEQDTKSTRTHHLHRTYTCGCTYLQSEKQNKGNCTEEGMRGFKAWRG